MGEIKRFTTAYIQGEMYLDLNYKQKGIVDAYNKKIFDGTYKQEGVACLCSNRSYTKLADTDRYGFWHPVVMCEACGFMYANPRPTWECLKDFYISGDYRTVYGDEIAEEKIYDEHIENGRRILMESAELLKARQIKNVFEFGCGGGWNLILFKEIGLEVSGCDFDKALLELGRKRGLDLKEGSFELLEERKYDFIILNHVVEHFNNFWEDISKIRNAMTRHGILYIATPNMSAFGCNRLQNAHTYYFKRVHLDFFMRPLGFNRLNSGYMFDHQDFFGIYDLSDDISMQQLGEDKENFKIFLQRINILK